jgi:hypothetical protein
MSTTRRLEAMSAAGVVGLRAMMLHVFLLPNGAEFDPVCRNTSAVSRAAAVALEILKVG